MRAWSTSMVLGAVLLEVGSVARAQPSSPGDRAEALKRRAFQHVAEGSYALGIDELEAAYALVPHPVLLFNIAVVYDQWPGHCEEALAAFERFFEACPDCTVRDTAEKRVSRVKARCEVRVDIRSEPADAAVTIDREAAGRTPTIATLLPGEHVIELDKPGFRRERRELSVRAGRDQALDLILEPERAEAVVAAPRSEGRGPNPWMVGSFVAAGAGAVLGGIFSALTVDTVDRETNLRESGTATPDAIQDLRSEARTQHALAVTGFSVAAVGAVTGVVLLFLEEDPGVAVSAGPRQIAVSTRF